MQRSLEPVPTSPRARAARLLARPWLLALLLLAIRSILYPYAGLVHDAILYGAQTMHRASGGQFASDLFFRFGSQDSYSVFSGVTAPLANALGLPTAFFLLYVASSALFLFAQILIVRRIVVDPLLAVASLAILAVADQTYGGWDVFVVQESFLTPRLAASALVLLAVDQAWDRHWLRAVVFQLAALALHPLMSVAGAGVLVLMAAMGRSWSRGAFVALSGVCIAGAIAVVVRLALTPVMDDDWLAIVRQISPHCFPSEWRLSDWGNLAIAVAAVVLAYRSADLRVRSFLVSTLVVGLGGLALSIVAEIRPVPLLVQGQGMRALWLVHFAAVPCAIVVALGLLSHASTAMRLVGAILVFWTLGVRRLDLLDSGLFWSLMATSIALAVMIARLRDPQSLSRSWVSVAVGMIVGGVIASLASTIAFVLAVDRMPATPDWLAVATYVPRASGSLLPIGLAIAALAILAGTSRSIRGMPLRTAAVLLVSLGATWWIRTFWIQPRGAEDVPHARFLLARAGVADPATVYWPTDIRNIWFGLARPSYLNFAQVQGAVFSRETAIEAAKRLRYARPFEVIEAHRNPWTAANWKRLGRFYGELDAAVPTIRDAIVAIASDPQLDYVLLEDHVPGLAADRCGELWVYDCAQIRTAMAEESRARADRPSVASEHALQRGKP